VPRSDRSDIDASSPPFDRLKGVRVLGTNRSGRESATHARHQLYVGRDKETAAQVLVKVTSRPGVFYERNLTNEIDNLTTINRALPAAAAFPVIVDHGHLRDGRLYLMTYLFDELPLAAAIGTERIPSRMVGHLRTAVKVADALIELHRLPIFHVDLNPMNILYRAERGTPVVRIVDFESSYDPARHTGGVFYDPPTTPSYSAPEVSQQPPDARADVFSLGAVLYTMLAGLDWTWSGDASAVIGADAELDAELRSLLLRAVSPTPARRHPSMDALRAALVSHLEGIWPGRSW
jgi:serine/threonine protein kinase